MSLLDLHAEDFAKAATNTAYIPPPAAPPASKFNAWKTFTAPARGARSGAQESIAFMADVLNAFGTAYATTEPAAPLGMLDPAPKDTAAARQQMLKGLDYNSEAGDLFREVARSSAPDPQTAHVAENLLYEFPRFATKAVGYSLAGGPVVGAGLTAADEGLTASDALRRQGVDLTTRTKVGAVQGVGAGLGVLLPVAGKTALQTAGLVAAGGPGTFIAQQAITREILKSADYSKLADQYDPLDPVGLAVSTLVPAGFGAFAMRGARRAKAADVPPREVVDAAMVTHQQEVRDAAALAPKEDLAAQAKHTEALARADEQMARGEPVRVAEAIEPTRVEPLMEMAATTRQAVADAGPDPWEVPASRPLVDALPEPAAVADDLRGMASMAFWSQEGGKLLRDANTDAPGTGGMGEVVGRTGWIPAEEWFGRMRAELGRSGLASQADIQEAIEKAIRGEPLRAAERRTVDWIRQEVAEMQGAYRAAEFAPADAVGMARDAVEAGLSKTDSADVTTVARAAEINPEALERAAIQFENDDAAFMAAAKEIVDGQAAKSRAGADAGSKEAGGAEGKAVEPATGEGAAPAPEEVAANTARLAEVEAQFPDLMVQMDGMEKPQRLSDFLAAVQRDADEMRADAPDFEVAANCFLTNGG